MLNGKYQQVYEGRFPDFVCLGLFISQFAPPSLSSSTFHHTSLFCDVYAQLNFIHMYRHMLHTSYASSSTFTSSTSIPYFSHSYKHLVCSFHTSQHACREYVLSLQFKRRCCISLHIVEENRSSTILVTDGKIIS